MGEVYDLDTRRHQTEAATVVNETLVGTYSDAFEALVPEAVALIMIQRRRSRTTHLITPDQIEPISLLVNNNDWTMQVTLKYQAPDTENGFFVRYIGDGERGGLSEPTIYLLGQLAIAELNPAEWSELHRIAAGRRRWADAEPDYTVVSIDSARLA